MRTKGYLVMRLMDSSSIRSDRPNVEILGEFLRLRDAEELLRKLNGATPEPKRKAWVRRITLQKDENDEVSGSFTKT